MTAFEPFGGEEINPAMLVLDEIKKQEERLAAKLAAAVLPVEFGCMRERIGELISLENPDAVICLGQAGGRAEITPERIAVNLADSEKADNAGCTPCDMPLCKKGPAAYFTTLPVKTITAAMKEAQIPARVSNTAGLFVCNCLMYHLLDLLTLRGRMVPAGFIHVPYLPEQAARREGMPGMELSVMTEGILIAIRETLSACSKDLVKSATAPETVRALADTR